MINKDQPTIITNKTNVTTIFTVALTIMRDCIAGPLKIVEYLYQSKIKIFD